MKQKHEDTVAWNYGRYVQQAIASVLGKGHRYPEKPFLTSVDPIKSLEETEEERARKQMELIKARFTAHAMKINANLEKQKGG